MQLSKFNYHSKKLPECVREIQILRRFSDVRKNIKRFRNQHAKVILIYRKRFETEATFNNLYYNNVSIRHYRDHKLVFL